MLTFRKTFKVLKLEGFDDVTVIQPGIHFYVDLIRRREYFTFLKRTHGFWDVLIDLYEVCPEVIEALRSPSRQPARGVGGLIRRLLSRMSPAPMDHDWELPDEVIEKLESLRSYKNFWRGRFANEVVRDLQTPHRHRYYFEANSFRGYSNSDKKPALHPVDQLRDVYHIFHTSNRIFHDGLVWKDAVFSGELYDVFDAIRDLEIIMVGPSHLENLGELLGLDRFHHVPIHATEATTDREELLKQCLQLAHTLARPKAFLFQAGALAYWIIYRMFPQVNKSFLLDFGRALDVWYPNVISTQDWFRDNRELIITRMHLEEFYR